MVITPHSAIKEIQNGFSKMFPFLKIEIFWDTDAKSESPVAKAKPDQKMSTANKMQNGHQIHISGSTPISILKKAFKEYGADIRIYRKSGRVWVETSLTGDWTLERQNHEGEMFTKEFE